jgi:hypothetical protein
MQDKKLKLYKTILYAMITGVIILCLQGCEILKNKKSLQLDDTAVSKKETAATDSSQGGSINKTETKTKEEFDWWRMTQLFDQNKAVPGETKVYPSTIVYEGGKGSKEQTQNSTDSTWFKNAISLLTNQVDSLNRKLEMKEKDIKSETKGVGLVMVIIIVAAAFVLYLIGKGLFKKFSIVKR